MEISKTLTLFGIDYHITCTFDIFNLLPLPVVFSDLKLPDVTGYYEFTGNYWFLRDFHWNVLPSLKNDELIVFATVGLETQTH